MGLPRPGVRSLSGESARCSQAIEDRGGRTAAMRKLAGESHNVRKQIVRELPEITDIVRSPTLSVRHTYTYRLLSHFHIQI